jgi:hypothetical protein
MIREQFWRGNATLIDAHRQSNKRAQEKCLPNFRLKRIMLSLPAAASNSDRIQIVARQVILLEVFAVTHQAAVLHIFARREHGRQAQLHRLLNQEWPPPEKDRRGSHQDRLHRLAVSPVVFPPGRARLTMKPAATGSETPAMTMGIVGVAFCRAGTAALVPVSNTSAPIRTNRKTGQPLKGVGSAQFADEILPLDIAEFAHSLQKAGVILRQRRQRRTAEHANPPHLPRYLRPRRQGPGRSRGAEEGEEGAAVHGWSPIQ